ncbi:MAG: hypothetical protein ACYDH4_09920 [Candidatus Cryosericum sp.]
MVIVTIAIWPHGDKTLERLVHRLEISNASDFADVSDYAVTHLDHQSRTTSRFRVMGHLRALGVVPLVRAVLERLRS